MPAEDPGEAVEYFFHDVVVQSLSVQILLPGSGPVGLVVQLNVGDCLLLDCPLFVRGRGEKWRHNVVLECLEIIN